MGQKIHPISLRLQFTNRHFDNCWYSNYFYKNLITRDIFLQQYFDNFCRLLKLPTGRYSIQHLQKKTQIYNFLCVPKSTREWRSKVLGLKKKKSSLTKTRYFFKNKTPLFFDKKNDKKKSKKYKKLYSFYTTLNQLAIYKIQKKITSFQNFELWWKFFKKSITKQECNLVFPTNPYCLNTAKSPNIFLYNCNQPVYFYYQEKIGENQEQIFTKSAKFMALLKKKKFFQAKQTALPHPNNSQKRQKNECIFDVFGNSLVDLKSNPPFTCFNLSFLQNLFVYKTLKSNLKIKKNVNFRKKDNVFFVPVCFPFKNKICFETPFFLSKKRMKMETKMENKSFEKMKNVFVFFPSLTKNPQNRHTFWPRLESNSLSVFNTCVLKYKNYLESSLSGLYKLEIDLLVFKIKNDWQHANYLADEIVYFLEKRITFRRLKSQISKQIAKIPEIRGVRITCSGRVGGKSKKAQRAKTECLKLGQTSLQVFSSKIDFSVKTARTSFGCIGVKVWICYK